MMRNIASAIIAGSIWGVGAVFFKLTLSAFSLPVLFGFLFLSAVGFVFFQAALKLGEATEANAFMMAALVIIPLFYGMYMGGEVLSFKEMFGITLLFIGTFFILLRQNRKRRASS